MEKTIAVLEGDGIGPEIMSEGLKVVNIISKKYGHTFDFVHAPFGGRAYFNYRDPFPEDTWKVCCDADAILKGPIGLDGKGSDELKKAGIKLENQTVIELRRRLDSYANYRPVILPAEFADFSPLKPEIVGDGLDIMMMRELTGGIYFGEKVEGEATGMEYARDDCKYTRGQIERFAHACFREAIAKGDNKMTSAMTNVHKDNVLATSRFWNAIFKEVSSDYPNIQMKYQLVDSFATFLDLDPASFNGVVCLENMFGDIQTDHGGGIIGSLGLMPSACLNIETNRGYFEPAHGSAPDIAGKNIANPYSMIGSVAFMLEKAFGLQEEAKDIWGALKKVFAKGYRTRELVRKLRDVQKEARVRYAVNESYPLFIMLNPNLTHEQATQMVKEHYTKKDASLEGKIVSTSQFGDIVKDCILKSYITNC